MTHSYGYFCPLSIGEVPGRMAYGGTLRAVDGAARSTQLREGVTRRLQVVGSVKCIEIG